MATRFEKRGNVLVEIKEVETEHPIADLATQLAKAEVRVAEIKVLIAEAEKK